MASRDPVSLWDRIRHGGGITPSRVARYLKRNFMELMQTPSAAPEEVPMVENNAGLNTYRCRHGWFMHFKSDQCIGKSLACYGEWSEYDLAFLGNLIRPGMTILDIGANIGTHAVAFGRMVGGKGRVIAIEAQPAIHALLSANVVHNHMENVYCVNALIGDAVALYPYEQKEEIHSDNFGAVSFARAGTDSCGVLFKTALAIIKLDDMELKHCDVIKIDVEGMELSVLSGGSKLLERFRPCVLFEQNNENNLPGLFDLFKKLEYRLFWHVSYPFNSNNYNKYPQNIFGESVETNIVAIPAERYEDVEAHLVGRPELREPVFNPPKLLNPLAGYAVPEYMPPVFLGPASAARLDSLMKEVA